MKKVIYLIILSFISVFYNSCAKSEGTGGQAVIKGKVIVENIISKWNIDNISNLKIDDFEDIVNTKPEIIIIGTGKEPVIPKLEIIKNIQDRQIGIEFMRTESACKTFNLLLSEERNVACILLV